MSTEDAMARITVYPSLPTLIGDVVVVLRLPQSVGTELTDLF